MANSRKLGGRCIAGLGLEGQGWIRPVSDRPDGTLFPEHYLLAGYREPTALDVIRVELTQPQPKRFQPENWQIGPKTWELSPHAPEQVRAVIKAALSNQPILLGSDQDHVRPGDPVSESLAIIVPEVDRWTIRRTSQDHRQIRVRFSLEGIFYDLPVTDVRLNEKMGELSLGVYDTAELKLGYGNQTKFLLTVSLGEIFNGVHYKLVASVLALRPETLAYLTS